MRWLGALPALAFAVPVAAAPAPAPMGVAVTVARSTDATWTADYQLGESARAWVFMRSNPDIDGAPWRQQAWTVETPGVTLIRAGRYDALVADGPVPRHVRIRFRPFGKSLRADYSPTLIFSDGGLALYSDQFLVAPRRSIAAVAALPADLDAIAGLERPNVVTFRDPGHRMVSQGKVTDGVAVRGAEDPDLYVYSGDAPIVETPTVAGIFDPGLPAWLRTEFDTLIPKLFALYTRRLGTPKGERPMAMVSWSGAANQGWSFSGSVLTGLVAIDMGGKVALTADPAVADRVGWFFGHESAHFWMGHTVAYDTARNAWITEGSADVLAVRALAALKPGYDARVELQREVDDCIKVNGAKPLTSASERGEVRANYACGAVLLLAAEAAERRRDPSADAFTFARRLIDANREDGKVSEADWLATFEQVSGDAVITARIKAFLDQGVADPTAFVAELFTATGVRFERSGDKLTLI